MIWIIVVMALLVALVLYGLGTFVPFSTNMCVVDVERGINDCFALANQPENFERLTGVTAPRFSSGDFSKPGSSGTIEIETTPHPFEVSAFIPNYRMAVVSERPGERWKVQLSFYRLSLNSCRLVLIATVSTHSRWKRLQYAFGKKQREQWINDQLAVAKTLFEAADQVPEHFEDVTAEENPNFSLR